MSKSGKKNRGTKGDRNISMLEQHRLIGKTLKPPFNEVPAMQLMSWRDDRLPDILWAVLLIGNLPRDRCLALFRQVVDAATLLSNETSKEILHSGIAEMDNAAFDTMFAPLMNEGDIRAILSALLLFDSLPDRIHWVRHLGAPDPALHGAPVASAVAAATDHQSQEATDCRWLKVLFYVRTNRMHLGHELTDELLHYPNDGDMRKVRPMIRASEGALGMVRSQKHKDAEFPRRFWQECWDKTDCIRAPRRGVAELDTQPAVKALITMYNEVGCHFMNCSTTELDARCDAVFGMVLYGINLALSINRGRAHNRIEGRQALRSLTEVYLTLAFLRSRDDKSLWEKWRKHGVGQAKLAFLKMLDLQADEVPKYIKIEELELMSNEDVWQEFTDIDLGNWAGLDLRKMSEAAGTKDIYDKYYGWPSSYVHGQWGAVRDTVFDLCLNPLHRFHRIPAAPRESMESVSPDSIKLVNLLLDQLTAAYPPFKPRIRLKVAAEADAKPEPETTPEPTP